MTAATFLQTNFTTQDPTSYKGAIDANFAVLARIAGSFAAHAQSTPNMTVRVDAGHIFNGTSLTEVAAQNTGTISAPSAHDRIDRIVIDAAVGTVSVVTGTEATSPVAPAIPSGKVPVAQILLHTSTTTITNTLLTDERDFSGFSGGGFGTQTSLASAATTSLATIPSRNALITGTTTITSFGTSGSSAQPIYQIEFAGALTLTHNGTSLILPGAANITTAAGDTAIVEDLGSNNWRVRAYDAASGKAVVPGVSAASNSQALGGTDTTHFLTSAAVASAMSIGSPGYIKLVGGIIIQWLTVSAGSTGGSFPLTFPNACFGMAHALSNFSGSSSTVGYYNLSTSGFNQHSGTVDVFWIAIGY